MPHAILRTPNLARVITHLDEMAGNLQHCEDPSALLLFVPDLTGREDPSTRLVSDPGTCARIWRGTAAVHQPLQEGLALVQAAAEGLNAYAPSRSGAP